MLSQQVARYVSPDSTRPFSIHLALTDNFSCSNQHDLFSKARLKTMTLPEFSSTFSLVATWVLHSTFLAGTRI